MLAQGVIPYLEQNADLAIVQAPQVYVDTEGLPVAEAATYQQAVFFEYVCEGKSHSNAVFCCGSNVISGGSGPARMCVK